MNDKYEQMISYLQAQDTQASTPYTCRVAKTEAEMRIARRRVRDLSVRCLQLRTSLASADSEDDISLVPELADILTARDAIGRYAIACMICGALDELVENYDTLYYRNFCQHYIPTNPREDIIKRLLDTI